MGPRQTAIAANGVGGLREQFSWDLIEPTAGQYDWSIYDQLMLSSAQHGLSVLPVLMRAPAWAQASQYGMPSDPSAYADFTAHVVSRYGPGGTFWSTHPDLASHAPQWFELWNEPYYSQYANNDIEPAAYARLVKAAGQAGKTANPNAKFLLEANDIAAVGAPGSGNFVDWIDALYQAVPDLNNYYDGVAVHPYSKTYSPTAPSNGYIHDKFARIATIHSDLIAHNAATKAMWITEIGWSTCSDATACVTPATQATYTQQLFTLLHTTYTYINAIFLYAYDDNGPTNSTNPETDYGLTQQDGTPKPVWTLLKTLTTT